MCRFGLGRFDPGSFRPNLDSNFVFFSVFLFINFYHNGRVGQYECVSVIELGIIHTCTALRYKPALWRRGRVFASNAEGRGFDTQPDQRWLEFSPVTFGSQRK